MGLGAPTQAVDPEFVARCREEPLVSVVIPSRNEEPRIRFTVNHVILTLMAEGVPGEIIVVDDSDEPQDYINHMRGCRHLAFHAVKTFWRQKERFKSAATARNFGAERARGKYLLFLDAHCLILPGSIKSSIDLVEDGWAEVIHFPQSWSAVLPDRCGHYILTLEKNFWGVQAHCFEGPSYYIASYTMGGVLVPKTVFEAMKGFNPYFLGYGGEEVYFDLKAWMMGYRVMTNTNAHYVHVFGPHQYGGTNEEQIRNFMLGARVVGGLGWCERLMRQFLGGFPEEEVKRAFESAAYMGEEEAHWFEKVRLRNLDEQLQFFDSAGITWRGNEARKEKLEVLR